MGLSSFFNSPKPRPFQYKPRFYDPEREKFREVKEAIDRELAEKELIASGKVPAGSSMKSGFLRNQMRSGRVTSKPSRASSSRLMVTLVLLAILIYIFIKY